MPIKTRQDRSLDLIANFVNGFAEGWYYAVGECFKDELDIKYTLRKELIDGKKKDIMRWTQGPFYSFKEGHTLYDTSKAYLEWSEALKYIRFICEVIHAMPNTVSDKKEFINGFVTFTLKKPNHDKTGITNIGQYTVTQNQFVNYIKTGLLKETTQLSVRVALPIYDKEAINEKRSQLLLSSHAKGSVRQGD